MLGPRVGPVTGPKPGGAVGPAANEIARVVSSAVPQDGPSSWYVPASAADFTALGIAPPDALYRCQEGSGNLADSIGALPLAAVGTVGYAAAVAGWTRVGATVAMGSGNGFGRAVADEPNMAARSVMWLVYADLTAGTGTSRCIITGSDSAGATEVSARVSAGDVTQVKCLTVATAGADNLYTGGVRAILHMYDRTNSRVGVFTEAEKVLGTYGAGVVDGNKGIRAGAGPAPAMTVVWAAMWMNANAELSDAQIKTRLQALNITIPWS